MVYIKIVRQGIKAKTSGTPKCSVYVLYVGSNGKLSGGYTLSLYVKSADGSGNVCVFLGHWLLRETRGFVGK